MIKRIILSCLFIFLQTNIYKIESFTLNASPVSLKEPGIGLMLVFSALQFLVGNLLIIFIESKMWTKFKLKKCSSKQIELIETNNVFIEASFNYFSIFF